LFNGLIFAVIKALDEGVILPLDENVGAKNACF
jgi:hypothetical protein